MTRPNDVAEARNRAAPKTILPGRPRKRRDVPARRASTSRQPAHCCGRRRRVRCGSADRRAFNARSRGTGFHIIILARSVRAQDKSRSQQRVGTCRVFSFPLIVRSERTLRRPAPQAPPPEAAHGPSITLGGSCERGGDGDHSGGPPWTIRMSCCGLPPSAVESRTPLAMAERELRCSSLLPTMSAGARIPNCRTSQARSPAALPNCIRRGRQHPPEQLLHL